MLEKIIFMGLVRLAHITEFDAYKNLLNNCFAVPKKNHFFDDFPIWNTHQVIRLGAFTNQILMSTAGLKISNIKIRQHVVKIGLIGAVATLPQYRGSGLAKKLVTELVKIAQQQECKGVLLWSEHTHFYEKLDFFPFGKQLLKPIRDLPLKINDNDSRVVQIGFNQVIFQHLSLRPHGVQYGESDWAWYQQHRHVEWYSTWDGSKLVAAIGYGRGIDLQNIVHEWVGDTETVDFLLNYVQKRYPISYLLTHPQFVKQTQIETTIGALGLFKPLSTYLDLNWMHDHFWIYGLDAV
jgi:N-acetylglutamate synthase-like GNAT family acetyltransferase